MKKITMEETRRIDVLKILNSLFQKYKNESWVLTGEQIRKKIIHRVYVQIIILRLYVNYKYI